MSQAVRQQKSLLMEELRRSASQRRRFGMIGDDDDDNVNTTTTTNINNNNNNNNNTNTVKKVEKTNQSINKPSMPERRKAIPTTTSTKAEVSRAGEGVKTRSLDEIVKGGKDESAVMQTQRQLKLSLNDEIRMKMQQRLKVMHESDSEEDMNVNDLD